MTILKSKQIFEFPRPLVTGKILDRYKRFIADLVLDSGLEVLAHVANSGSMKTCWQKFCPVIATDCSADEKRNLKYSLQAVKMPDGWICVNTFAPNQAVKNAIAMGLISQLTGYDFLLPEVKISQHSRIDLMLWSAANDADACAFNQSKRDPVKLTKLRKKEISNENLCFIEIKNVTLLQDHGLISFPDVRTERGQKHLQELISLKKQGYRAMIVFFVARNSAEKMTTARDIDPQYDAMLKEAIRCGVEAVAIKVRIGESGLFFDREIEIIV